MLFSPPIFRYKILKQDLQNIWNIIYQNTPLIFLSSVYIEVSPLLAIRVLSLGRQAFQCNVHELQKLEFMAWFSLVLGHRAVTQRKLYCDEVLGNLLVERFFCEIHIHAPLFLAVAKIEVNIYQPLLPEIKNCFKTCLTIRNLVRVLMQMYILHVSLC